MNITLKTILIASGLTLGWIGTASAQIGFPYPWAPYGAEPSPANPSAPKPVQEHRSAAVRTSDYHMVQRVHPSHKHSHKMEEMR
jgi:hypothetical protein